MRKGFTLIELLIVVAIIAILAAIAVPNFLEAQTRSKVSRVKADMRSIATALEAYAVDANKYPWDGVQPAAPDPTPISNVYLGCDISTQYGIFHFNNMLTTPISYMTTVEFKDPFNQDQTPGAFPYFRYFNIDGTYRRSANTTRQQVYRDYYRVYGNWVLSSFGPNRKTDTVSTTSTPPNPICEGIPGATASSLITRYDSTNGTISQGDVMRCQMTNDNPNYPGSFPIP